MTRQRESTVPTSNAPPMAANWARSSGPASSPWILLFTSTPLEAFIQWRGGGFTSAFGHAIGREPCAFAFFCSRASNLTLYHSSSPAPRGGLALPGAQLFATFRIAADNLTSFRNVIYMVITFNAPCDDVAVDSGVPSDKTTIIKWPLAEYCTALNRLENRRAKNLFRVPSALVFSMCAWPFWL
jgi:hypothetical protein